VKVLILGGTTEARLLAASCAGRGLDTVSSLAGRTKNPLALAGTVRIGGFGGVAGLADYLRAERVGAVVDATHPFAAGISLNAVHATALTRVPLLALRRPGFVAVPGDRWHRVGTVADAASLVADLGSRVFLTTGRQEIGAFAGVDRCWFLARSVEPPEPPMPARIEVLLDRGPFTVEGERALIDRHHLDVLVTKDSGGDAPKLAAAREASLPVILVDRPPVSAGDVVGTVGEAMDWLVTLRDSGGA
jgi:precorrin-6A/cobalt-precorrin-6A reductase